MLTKDDLLAIQNIVDHAVEKGNKSLEEKMKRYFKEEIKKVVDFFDKEIVNLKVGVTRTENHLGLPPIL